MKRALAAVALVGAFTIAGPAAAFADEHHPPKFGVHDTQCASDANQPWCPGNH